MHHAYSVIASLTRWEKASSIQIPFTYYFCVLISKQFPTLLAKREIIANALLFTDKLCRHFRRFRKDNNYLQYQTIQS